MDIKRDDNYEFNEVENGVIGKLSSRMYWVAVVLLILGGIKVFEGLQTLMLLDGLTGANFDSLFRGMLINFLLGAVFIVMGIITLNVSQSFKLVVSTEGSDIDNLLSAVRSLTQLQTVTLVLIILTIISTASIYVNYLLSH